MSSNEDKHLPRPVNGQRIRQLSFFDLLDPQDNDYSQAIALYDLIPKYVRYGRIMGFNQDNRRITRTFKVRDQEFNVNIYPAQIETEDDDGESTVHFMYPNSREEIVEDALRKITVSQGRARYDDDGGFCTFTLYELQEELRACSKLLNYSEIKEALNILHQTRIEVERDGRKVTSGYLLPSLTLTSRDDLDLDRDTRCTVRFHEIVSVSIRRMKFRQFNYRMSMSFKLALSRYLFKRLSDAWRQASEFKPYTIGLFRLLRDAGEDTSKPIAKLRTKVKGALDELVAKQVLSSYDEEVIKHGRKIVDARYTFETSRIPGYSDQSGSFVRDQKRANRFEREQSAALQEQGQISPPN